MGNVQVYIPEDILKVILLYFQEYKDIEFPDFHNIACTSKLFNKLVPFNLLMEKYDLFHQFKKLELTDEEILEHMEKDDREVTDWFNHRSNVMYKGKNIGYLYKQKITIEGHNLIIHINSYIAHVTTSMLSNEVLNKLITLGGEEINDILQNVYDKKAHELWRGKELDMPYLCWMNNEKEYIQWDPMTNIDREKYIPKIIFVNQVKFMYEFMINFKDDIEEEAMKY